MWEDVEGFGGWMLLGGSGVCGVSGGPRVSAPCIPRVLAARPPAPPPRASPARFALLTRAPLTLKRRGRWMDVPSAEAPAFAGMTEGLQE